MITLTIALLAIYGRRRQRGLERRLETERALVTVLQSALINHQKRFPGTDFGATYISATDGALVGGDFYDFQPLDAVCGYVLVGDISGKGVNAAVDTALLRYGVRALLTQTRDPGAVLAQLNRLFIDGRSDPDEFVVVFLGIVDLEARELRYASAGHSQAYLRSSGGVAQLPVTGALLGVFDDLVPDTRTQSLTADDLLLVTTDGLTEARGRDGVMLGEDGAATWIAEAKTAAAQGLVDELVARFRNYSPAIQDDLAMVAMRIRTQ